MKTLRRESGTPLHQQLHSLLLDLLRDGDYDPGDPFLSDREIQDRFHVSRATVREAVNELVRTGYVTRVQGKGTFVTRSHTTIDATKLSSFTEDMEQRGMRPGSSLIDLRREPTGADVRKRFRGEVNEVWKVSRLRFADDEPLAIQISYLSCEQVDLKPDEVEHGSLYEILASHHGIFVSSGEKTISATVADEEQARLLNIKPGMPLLQIDRTTFAHTGKPVEFVHMFYRADRYRLTIHQTR